ncbi:ParB/RepB/Spo0J family partition protein [Mycolicibacterium houstonense]|uniref:ParB/RepB/Spo0J family partition protein n=1 Tax=Mycolicibacterium houstonense TaxID=146021 RepID=UPI003F99EFAD
MTDTSINTEATTSEDSATLEHLDPRSLVVDTNVRNVANLKTDFIASIKEHGVLEPIVAIRDSDGQVLVRMGQRRTLAAREAGLTTVPVYVRPHTTGDQTVERVSEQIVENDHRDDLTDADRARGIQQMMDAGLSVTKVAKKLSVDKETVKAADTVRKSTAAMQALDGGQLSLTEAAALTEFEDFPDALDRLTSAAGTPRFDHVVAQLREQQASWQAQLKAEAQWRDKGFTILEDRPRPWDIECVSLRNLRSATGDSVSEDVVTDPAQWAVLVEEEEAWIDAETGEVVDESTVDWNTEDNPEATPEKGMRHYNSISDGTVFVPAYYCLDYAAAGLTVDPWFLRYAQPEDTAESSTGGDSMSPADDGEGDTPAAEVLTEAQRQEQEAEDQRRARRKVIALNRLGEAATGVRREFVTKLLTRKTLPKGASIFIAECLFREPALINDYHAAATTNDLLGVPKGQEMRKFITDLPPTGDGRAQVLILAVVLGALEARTPKDAWRSGGARPFMRYSVGSADYVAFLAENGYELSEVERIIVGERTEDEVYDETLAASADADTSDNLDEDAAVEVPSTEQE